MSKRLSTIDLQAEYLYRVMTTTRGQIGVNCEGGIGRDNPALQRLIKQGRVVLKRGGGRTFWNAKSKNRGMLPAYRTRAFLVNRPAAPIVTCPCCGNVFARRVPAYGVPLEEHQYEFWLWNLSYANEMHAVNCTLRQDHWKDRFCLVRQNQTRERRKNRS